MQGDIRKLIARLERLSPMPGDESVELTPERLREYEMIIWEIESSASEGKPPDSRLLEPLLRSLGYGDGFGLYWGALHLLERFSPDTLRPALRQALRTGERGTRRWAVYMLGRYRNREDLEVLVQALRDPEEEVRTNALMALTMVGDPAALPEMVRLLDDPKPEVRKAAQRWTAQLRDQQHN